MYTLACRTVPTCSQPCQLKRLHGLQVCMCVKGSIVDITELAKCNGLMYEADGITMVSWPCFDNGLLP